MDSCSLLNPKDVLARTRRPASLSSSHESFSESPSFRRVASNPVICSLHGMFLARARLARLPLP